MMNLSLKIMRITQDKKTFGKVGFLLLNDPNVDEGQLL